METTTSVVTAVVSSVVGFSIGYYYYASKLKKKTTGTSYKYKNAAHKMLLVVRTDLKMGKGKIAAQCGHATLGTYQEAMDLTPEAVNAWEHNGCAKVAVKVTTEEELVELASVVSALGIPHYQVVDAGRTQVAPDSKTVLGIGPVPVSIVNPVTEHLKLL